MGIGEAGGPQKKRLKQAQLSFSIHPGKVGNKRKLNEESTDDDGHAVKVIRKDAETSRRSSFNKENVKVNTGDLSNVPCIDLSNEDDPSQYSESKNDSSIVESSNCEEAMEVCARPDASESTEDKEKDEDEISRNTSGFEENAPDQKIESSKPSEIENDKVQATKKDKVRKSSQKSVVSDFSQVESEKLENRNEECESLSVELEGSKSESEISQSEKEENDELNATSETSEKLTSPKSSHEKRISCSIDEVDKSSLDLSVESNQGDLNVSVVVSSEEEELNVSKSPGNKKSLRAIEHMKRQEEKRRIMLEKEELKRRKKVEREKKKMEEMKMKEEDRKRKEELRKHKEEVKEEERKRKEDEKKKKEEAKEEEKRKKEEEKRKKEEVKEEDRKRKEEARLAEERKENLAKLAFTKFFIQNKTKTSLLKKEDTDGIEVNETNAFMPFPLKSDMRLAPQTRRVLTQDEKVIVDEFFTSQPQSNLYLDEIKTACRVPLKTAATWPLSEEQHDVIIVESVSNEKMDLDEEVTSKVKSRHQRAKLLQFHDNRRPPYWGTWRKKSVCVTPRKPFGQDKLLDYEVDSDSEWEDEDEGEDIDKEGESDKEQSDDENVGENGYVLDKTFVPHGYLSDEEAAEEEDLNPEGMKLKMKVLKQEFERDIKTKAQHIKPRLLGCVWISNETTEVSKGSLYETLMNYRCRWAETDGPVNPFEAPPADPALNSTPMGSRFPPAMVERLVKFIHGSRSSRPNIILGFLESLENDKNMSTISKRSVSRKINEIATKAPDASGRAVWKVNPDLCAEYNLELIPDSKSVPPTPSPPKVVTPTSKGKDTTLTTYLKKASNSPNELRNPVAKKRLTPILVSSLPKAASPSLNPTHPPATMSTVEKNPTPPVRKRVQPITLSKTVSIPRLPPFESKSASQAIKSFFGSSVKKAESSTTSADVITIEDSN